MPCPYDAHGPRCIAPAHVRFLPLIDVFRFEERFRMRRLALIASLISLALLATPSLTHAKGSRKDDIVLNRLGQPVAGAAVTVCLAGATGSPCSPKAGIFSDVALTQPLSNPLTTDGQGNYHFYAT